MRAAQNRTLTAPIYAHVAIELASAAFDTFLAAMPQAAEFMESRAGWRFHPAGQVCRKSQLET
jgi:hypothetical protein